MTELALYGGDPVRRSSEPLPYTEHQVTPQDVSYVTDALTSDWIAGDGPFCRDLEWSLCKFTGYDHAVVVNSGTAALMLAYATALKHEESIHTTPLTFVATANAALALGKRVILHDIDEDNYTLMGAGTRGSYVPVSYAGYPVIAANVCDDAHYLYENMAYHRDVNVSCISLHPAKHVAAGEGGAILTDDGNVAEHCRALRDHGRVGGRCEMVGYNFRLSDINAALATSQLKRAQENIHRRAKIASDYYDHWHEDERIILPESHPRHAWHLFVIRLSDIVPRKFFMDALKAEGITCQVHYEPIHRLPIYKNNEMISRVTAEGASWFFAQDAIFDSIVSIPLFPAMREQDIQDVKDAVDKVLDYCEGNL